MRIAFVVFFAAFFSLFTAAQAQNNPVVVELFTSQGCSSCPPADALLAELAKRDDVITLALHVDYWDYLGWRDTFSNAEFTQRQRAYARAAHKSTVYTPQMVVQGQDHVVGTHAQDVKSLIAVHNRVAKLVDLQIRRTGNSLTVTASTTAGPVGATVVHLVRYLPEKTVKIKRGENSGRNISYSSIVTDWAIIGNWNGRDNFSKSVTLSGAAPVVVIIQRQNEGRIIAASRLR